MRRPGSRPSREVDEYLERVPAAMRETLQELRETIRRAAPHAEEVLSYKMPAFRYNGMLVYYAAFRDHGSFFVASYAVLRKFARELAPFTSGKATLRFTSAHPLPATIVRRIVTARIAENEARVAAKSRAATLSPSSPRRRRAKTAASAQAPFPEGPRVRPEGRDTLERSREGRPP